MDRPTIEKAIEVLKSVSSSDKKNLVNDAHDKVFLNVTFKLPPSNRTTYINNFRSLPHPYHHLDDSKICLIVSDRAHKPLADRDLDLRLTREFYEKRLLEAGIGEDIIKHRLFILPMRELLTEYRLPKMKRRLAVSFDVFLADTRLIKNRFKLLPGFLGHKFWIEKKKFPIGVCLKRKGDSLKQSFDRALRTCTLYITGHGPDTSIQFGLLSQTKAHLADNLEFILQSMVKTYGKAIQLLKVKSTFSLGIPFFADLTRPTKSVRDLMPRTPKINSQVAIDDHPFVENGQLAVYPTGKVALIKNKKDKNKPEGGTNVNGEVKVQS